MKYDPSRRGAADLAQVTEVVMSHQSIDTLLQDLPKMVNLRRLVLQHCGIDDDKAILLSVALQNCKLLEELDLQYNCIGPPAIYIMDATVQRSQHIKTYYIQGRVVFIIQDCIMSIGNQMTIDNLEDFLQPCAGHLSLQRMCLSEMNLGNEGATMLANHFPNMPNLNTLHFYRNGVSAEGADGFAKNLHLAAALKRLDLRWNCIPEECKQKFEWMNRFRLANGQNTVLVDLDNQDLQRSEERAVQRRGYADLAQVTEVTWIHQSIDDLLIYLPKMINLRRLVIPRCPIDAYDRLEIAARNLKKLVCIDIH